MSTALWPPLVNIACDDIGRKTASSESSTAASHALLEQELKKSQAAELSWLLKTIENSILGQIKCGLEECAALLEPSEPGSTLVLSTVKSEFLKGYITRVGTRFVKGDIKLKVSSSTPFRDFDTHLITISQRPTAPVIQLKALASLRTIVNSALDVVDSTLWSGPRTDANYMSGQLKLLSDYLDRGLHFLRDGSEDGTNIKPWWEDSVDAKSFDPPLPDNCSFHFSLHQCALVLSVRILDLYTEAEARQASHPSFLRSLLATPQSVLRSLQSTSHSHPHSSSQSDPHHPLGRKSSSQLSLSHSSARLSDTASIRSHVAHNGTNSVSSSTTTTTTTAAAVATSGQQQKQGHPAAPESSSGHGSSTDSPIGWPMFNNHYAKVREMVTVETFDPKFISVSAKLAHLKHMVTSARRNLAVVMGGPDDDIVSDDSFL